MVERVKAQASLLSWIGLLLILVGAFLPALLRQGGTSVPAWITPALLVVGAILALAWPVLRPEEVRSAMGGRRTRFGGNALILTVAVVGILVLVNLFSWLWFTVIDMTENRQFSISRQTVQILDDLDDQPITVTLTAVLSSLDRSTTESLDRLMEKYTARARNLTYERIDPQTDPLAVMGLGERIGQAQSPPTRAIVAETAARHAVVYSGFDEQAVTEAIVKVTRAKDRTVAFTTGHGEYDPNGSGERGYYTVKAQLEREGYTVEALSLATMTETLTADTTDVLVVAGPTQPFLPQEADLLSRYMREGGAMMLMLDPAVNTGLDSLLAPWDITLNDDLVLQRNILGVSSAVVVAGDDYQFHTITKDLTAYQSVFPDTRSLVVGTPVTTSLQTTALVELQDQGAWGETNLAALREREVGLDSDDLAPPLTLAVAAEATSSTAEEEAEAQPAYGRLVVFGTSAIAADDVLQQYAGGVANGNLILNAVNWLGQEEDLVSIRPTSPSDHPIERPRNPLTVLLFTSVLLPLAVLGVGTWMYWRHR